MSHKAVNWVINDIEFPKEVKPPARWLLIQIADRADRDTWDCYPSHKTLAADAGMSKRTVLDLLFVLEGAGLITRTPQFRANGERTSDLITLVRGSAITAPGGDGNIQPTPPQHSTEILAKAAAHNLVTEPGKRTDLVLSAPDPFEAWWAEYPRKAAKVAARKAWAQMTKEIAELTLAELMVRTRLFAASVVNKDAEHIAHPATWLRGERWNDELPTHRSQTDGQSTRYPATTDPVERRLAALRPMAEGAQEALDRRSRRRWGV